MSRVNRVGKSAKAHKCGRCGDTIAKGEPYLHTKPRYGSKMVRCTKSACRFRPTDLSGAKTAQVDEAIEDAEELIANAEDIDSIKDALNDLAQTARDVASEYEEASSNWAGGQNERFDEQAQACNGFADEIDSWEPSGDVDDAKKDARAEVEREDGESDEDFEKRCVEAEDDAEQEMLSAARDEANDALSNWSPA